jgi:hypothetical protein
MRGSLPSSCSSSATGSQTPSPEGCPELNRPILQSAILALLACGVPAPDNDSTPGASPDVEILLTARDTVAVRPRPDSASGVWGQLLPGDSVPLSGVTRDGWLGFDPGVAQAGNSGSFRYRWIAPGGPFLLTGDPGGLDSLWGPAAAVVYAMTFDPVPVFVEPDSLATAADSLPGGSAARIVSRLHGWYLVDPSFGPSPETVSGWVREEDVSVSGDLRMVPLLADPVLPSVDQRRVAEKTSGASREASTTRYAGR